MIKQLLIGAVVIILLLGGLLWYLSQGIEDVSLERVSLEGISEITTESLTIQGSLYLHNPSNLPVPVDNITYDVLIGDAQEKIGTGVIQGFLLAPQTTTQTMLDQEIFYESTTRAAINLLRGDADTITVQGTIYVDLEVHTQKISFEEQTSIQEQLTQ